MALLLLLASIFIIFIGLVFSKVFSREKVSVLLAFSFLLIIMFSYFFPEVTDRAFFSTLIKLFNWRTSDYGLIWQGAYEVWMQSPIFGAGLHMFKEACASINPGSMGGVNISTGGISPFSQCGLHAHNITLQLLSEVGVVGFILFYLMVFTLTISSLKIYFTRKLWLSFALVFSILFTCFLPIASSTSLFANKYGAIIWLLVGVMLAINRLFVKENFS